MDACKQVKQANHSPASSLPVQYNQPCARNQHVSSMGRDVFSILKTIEIEAATCVRGLSVARRTPGILPTKLQHDGEGDRQT
jgi:hypothetical protein